MTRGVVDKLVSARVEWRIDPEASDSGGEPKRRRIELTWSSSSVCDFAVSRNFLTISRPSRYDSS